MTAVPDVGRATVGGTEAGSPSWLAAVGFVASALGRLGRDRLGAEALLLERGLAVGAANGRSANGFCRLLRTADGWVAVNLPRPDDLELLPAWLGAAISPSSMLTDERWDEIADALASCGSVSVVDTAQELGLAVAMVPISEADQDDAQLLARSARDPSRPFLRTSIGGAVHERSVAGLRVVDLSSLWAGPLCSRLLAEAGADVIKVESTTRPDGTRLGDPELFQRLHAGKRFAQVPFGAGQSSAALRELLETADVIIEGSRPRALERLGIDPAVVLAAQPGKVWLSITAYGRTGPWRNRVGFGDDAAAAAGLLVGLDVDAPEFLGDAIADPLTGVLSAALVADAVAAGGGLLVDVALREVARSVAVQAKVQW
jgi:crotonobetainyl-CoA:carnitine CoA-transferase CaiB-like acyl-CoA transferase